MNSRAVLLGVLIPLAFVCACAGPRFRYADLPPTPIAIVYRTLSESDQAYDAVLKQEKQERVRKTGASGKRAQRWYDKNKLNAEDIVGMFAAPDAVLLARLGRLALVDPHTGDVEIAQWAKRGSRPLDWSADRKRLLYLSQRSGEPHVFEHNVETGETNRLTYDRRRYLAASYCGDRGLVTASAGTRGHILIHYRAAQTGAPIALTAGGVAFDPLCTADGKTVVFQTMGPAPRHQAVIGAVDVDEPLDSVRMLASGRQPSISTDGQWVVYSARQGKSWKLWRMRPDGTGRHPLGRGPDREATPTISPDGRFVAFVTTEEERPVRQRLWVRPMDGDADRPLRVDGDALHPVW